MTLHLQSCRREDVSAAEVSELATSEAARTVEVILVDGPHSFKRKTQEGS